MHQPYPYSMEVCGSNIQSKPSASGKKYGRNDKIKISNGSETKIIKFKKAEDLLNQGWSIIE